MGRFDSFIFGFITSYLSLDTFAIGMVIGQSGMHLCQIQVPNTIADFFGHQTQLVPTNDTLHGNTSASNARAPLPNLRRSDDQLTDIND